MVEILFKNVLSREFIKRRVRPSGLIFVFLLFNVSFCWSQEDYSLLNHFYNTDTRVFITENKNLDVAEVVQPKFRSNFVTLPKNHVLSVKNDYWFLMDLANVDFNVSDQWFIRFIEYDEITLYCKNGETLVPRVGGKLRKSNKKDVFRLTSISFKKEELIEGRFLFAKIKQISRPRILEEPNCTNYFTLKFITDYRSPEQFIYEIPFYIFIGGMLLMILYSFGVYFMNRDKLFNYYAIYLLSLLLYIGIRAPFIGNQLKDLFPLGMFIFNELIQVIVNVFYLLFALIFLNAKTDFPKLYIAIRIVVMLLVGIMVLQLIVLVNNRFSIFENYIIYFERYFVIAFTVFSYIYILIHYKKQIVLFLLLGSFFFMTGAILAMVLFEIRLMMLGAGIEVFIFSLGLGYRMKVIEQEKISIEAEIDKVRLTALRAQMNPHFIFNSLNSIRAYVISNNTKLASDYLTKFSSLIRLILQYSSQNSISLKDELDALELYVNLEQLRYRDDFGFEIIVDKNIEIDHLKVPPLILQPYVENAIGHGLAPKKGEKKLELNISIKNSQLEFRIKDNGLGRQYSKRLKDVRNDEHISMAMDLTQKRIELADISTAKNGNIIIVDLMEDGKHGGTEVILKLPVKIG